MDSSKKSNKIREIVRLQQILKKWKKIANTPKNDTTTTTNNNNNTNNNNTTNKSIKFLKKTLSFSDNISVAAAAAEAEVVPKGFLAVCVGKELKRYVIPTEYLGHQAFGILLREAEEEFGFQQEGVLKIPCKVCVFENILKVVEDKKRDVFFMQQHHHDFDSNNDLMLGCYSPDCELTQHSNHPQMCR